MASNAETDAKAKAEALREEGNALHRARKYKEAHAKYSEAIDLDDDNAILYANRAACSVALREYLDTATDAEKAVALDPQFAKAWARLGLAYEGLFLWENAISAWKKALKCLPQDASNRLPTDVALRKQFTEGWKSAEVGMNKMIEAGRAGTHVTFVSADTLASGEMPWQKACVVANETNKNTSSVSRVMKMAFHEFSNGVQTMKMTRQDGPYIAGLATALVDVTNAILREPRVFHADKEFWEKLSLHITLEFKYHGGWSDAGPREVQKKAYELQQTEGWEASRRALSTTVRAWVLRAFVIWATNREHGSVLEYYKNAITVLEWGLHTWPNVPDADRGVIFSPTFMRGIRRLYLEVFIAACKDLGAATGYRLDTAADLANKMLGEIEANEVGNEHRQDNYSFYHSFVTYPRAEAYAALGLVAMQRAMQARSSDNTARASNCFAESAGHYTKAGMLYPEDDEKRIVFLWVAFEAMWNRSDPLRDTLPLLKKISDTYPAVEKIWDHSANGPTCRADVWCARIFIQNAALRILGGVHTLDTPSSQIDYVPNQEAQAP